MITALLKCCNKTDHMYPNGSDKVQFTISTNPGQPLEPIEEIVSGGELSRIMLALKTVFVGKDEIPSVIFDEIDTGISGRVAQRVAEKMFLSDSTVASCRAKLFEKFNVKSRIGLLLKANSMGLIRL
mgnify:CR=1 FL=1